MGNYSFVIYRTGNYFLHHLGHHGDIEEIINVGNYYLHDIRRRGNYYLHDIEHRSAHREVYYLQETII
jgi:hypothetical protein